MLQINPIDDTGIVSGYRNGAKTQDILFRIGENRYKISIRSETHDFQSFARLFKWTQGNGFEPLIDKNPKRDFGIDISGYRTESDKNAFEPIISNLEQVAQKFEGN